MRLVNFKREKRILPTSQEVLQIYWQPKDEWVVLLFIPLSASQQLWLLITPPKVKKYVVFHSLLSGSCHREPGVCHHNKVLSLFTPVTSHHGGEKRCMKGFGGRNDLQPLRERQAWIRLPSLQRDKRYSGSPGTPRTGLHWEWHGRLDQRG